MKRLKDAWAVLRGRKRALDPPPAYNPFASDHSVIGWRYVVSNQVLASEPYPEWLARVISRQAERDVYKHIVKRAREFQT